MDPSSLIFLAIIAIWAAYLVGQWVRRRDQLATARSIDRFSEAMRVLERRTPTRPVSAARPTARSYVVAPVRVPAPSASRASGPSASGAAAHTPHTLRAARTSAQAVASHPTSPRATRSGGLAAVAGHPAAARPRITRQAARRRARLLLGLVAATVLAWTLAATTSLVWWPAAVVTIALAAVLVQLRRTARPVSSAERRSTPGRSDRGARSAVRRLAGRSSSRSRRSLASRVPAPARRARSHEDARSVLDKVDAARRSAESIAGYAAVTGTALADVEHGPEPVGLTEAVASVAAKASADGWKPVPVPPPTYTLKPKAPPIVRRPVESDVPVVPVDEADDITPGPDHTAHTADAQRDDVRRATREPAPAAPAFDLDEILERRIASGS